MFYGLFLTNQNKSRYDQDMINFLYKCSKSYEIPQVYLEDDCMDNFKNLHVEEGGRGYGGRQAFGKPNQWYFTIFYN